MAEENERHLTTISFQVAKTGVSFSLTVQLGNDSKDPE